MRSWTGDWRISETIKYDKHYDRFELGDTVLYEGKKWRITSKSYQPKDRFRLVNLDDDKEKIEVDVNEDNKRIENLEIEH